MTKSLSYTRRRLILLALSTFLIGRSGAADDSSGEFLRHEDFQGRAALVLSNDVLEVTVLPFGGAIASIVLKDDAEKTNPLWDSLRHRNQKPSGPISRRLRPFTDVDSHPPRPEEWPPGDESCRNRLFFCD